MTAETKTCQQCGRTGTRGFIAFPTEDATFNSEVVVPAMSMTECSNKAACRKRWPKDRTEGE